MPKIISGLSLLMALAPLSALAFAAPAHAGSLYVGADVGAQADNELSAGGGSFKMADGLVYAVHAGDDLGFASIEVEAARANADTGFGIGEAVLKTAQVKALVHPWTFGAVRPYAEAGYGHAWGSLNFGFGSVSQDGDLYSYGLGTDIKLTDKASARLGYEHTEASFDAVDYSGDAFKAGLNFKFG